MNNEYKFENFALDVADYIEAEYSDNEFDDLNEDERLTIRNMLDAHYHFNDSISNAANYVINYLRTSRNWLNNKTNN
ncbi:MAG: hypothetical protein EBZ62_06490 [Sphingobacteriia bacterium]|nr:hypothetical protein [Sphingobacteriia bacterium]